MKTYIVTEKDISDIKSLAILNDDIAIDDILENLNELPPPKKLELNENRTEFSKFIEDSGFIKPEQPYYIKDGEVFEYGDLRQLFLKSREKD
jgi:hypothetical protein